MRKMNPFIYFSQQKRAAVKAEVEASIDAEATPQERNREVLARIGALWKALSDADKQKWKDEAPEKETTVKKKIAAPVLDCVEIKFRAPHAVDATSSLRLRLLDGVGGSHATLIHIHAGARPEEEEEGRDREAREDARPARGPKEGPQIRQPIYDLLALHGRG